MKTTSLSKTLENVALSFLKAFASSLIVVIVGISTQPTIRGVTAVYIGAVIAALAAGVTALQAYVPALTFRRWIKDPYGQLLDTFSHGFLSAFLVSLAGFFHQQDLTAWKAAITAALVGAIAAGFRVVQNSATVGAAPLVAKGVLPPDPPPPGAPSAPA